MDRVHLAVALILLVIVVFTWPVVKRSAQNKQVVGGVAAYICHILAVAAYIGVLPSGLFGSLLVDPLSFGVPVAIGLLGLSVVALLGYGFVEYTAHSSSDDPMPR